MATTTTTSHEHHSNMPTVAIVGAGFSGTMTAVQLARQSRRASRPLRIVIIEPSGKFGSGVAYGTRCTKHVLNVPAGNMSALPEEPANFVQWTRAHGISDSPDAFVPRYWYGVYLHDLLEEARHEAHIERRAARVMDILPDGSNSDGAGARVVFDQGEALRADRVILAGGNFPPSDAQLAESGLLNCQRYLRDPWGARALLRIGTEDDLLMVGTGLTMLDVVVQLRSGGHRGRVHAVSRRGLVPQPHRPPKAHVAIPIPKEVAEAPPTAAGLLRGVRRAVRRLAKQGIDWRDVVASLRSHTVVLWTSLNERERGKFLRHVRPYWDTHRHRIPLDLVGDVDQMRSDGTLVIHRARIARAESRERGIHVTLRPRAGQPPYDVDVAWVINCTGPDSDIRRVQEPLWKNLLARGVVRPDPHAIGVVTAPDGALVDRDDNPSRSIYLVGPLRKAQLWESTAVPELRVQAAEVARTVLASVPVAADVPASAASTDQVDHIEIVESDEGGREVVPIYAGEYI
jgi:uncharacterized NAD(P)/FAD-binding protein YdhS